MKKITFILVFLLFIQPVLLLSQNYHTRNFTMKDGMPSNSVRSILKDSKGYLWVGTDAGLCRFDGKTFKIYSSDEGFNGSNIWSIAEDGNKNMWFGDYGGGLWKFDGKEFSHFTDVHSIVNNKVRSLHYSNKWNLLFIGTQFGLTVFDGKNFTSYDKDNSFLDYDPYIMGFIEREDAIYMYTFTAVNFAYYPETKKLSPRPEGYEFSEGGLISCFKRSDETSILAYRNGLVITDEIDTLLNMRVPVNAPNNKDIGQIFGMAEDRFQNVWLASWEPDPKNPGGLFLFDGEKVSKQNSILGKDPTTGWSVYYDTENSIVWFGTLDMGLFMIQESIFEYIEPETFGLNNWKVNDISLDKNGNLILVNEKNLIISYKDKPTWRVPNKLFFNAYHKYTKKEGIIDERTADFDSFLKVLVLKKLSYQNDSVLWVMSEPGLFKVNLNNEEISCYDSRGYGGRDLYFDDQGRLCNVSYWGPYSIYRNIELHVEIVKTDVNTILPKDITDFLFLDSEVWMTSWSRGLFRGKDTLFVNYNQSNTRLTNALNTICVDNTKNIIVGANNGIVYFTKPTEDSLTIFRTLDTKDGIIGNSINWLEVDTNNQLWIGTNIGLNQIDLNNLINDDELLIKTYNEQEGYLYPNVNVSFFDEDGNIWLGTNESLVRMLVPQSSDTALIERNINLVNYEINGISMLGKVTVPNTDSDLDKAYLFSNLSHDQNYLHFDFDVINFTNPDKDHFRYFLEGLDMGWSDFSETRHATYPHLPPGKYTFRVEGKNLNTGTFYSPLAVKIHIHFPFWRSWWFAALFIVLFGSFVWSFFKYRINQTKKDEQKKAEVSKQLAELEMKALLAQMNPHFTFNAINSIQNYILDNDVDKALSYLSDFSKIIRETLENASKEFISLEEEIEYMKRYLFLEQIRFDKQFEYEIIVDPDVNLETILIPPMIVQPYAENAIKHGLRHKKRKGKLNILFGVIEPDILTCFVEDNGIGRKASEEINKSVRKDHNGAGMHITKNRIQKLKEVYKSDQYNVNVIDLLDSDNHPKGTRVEIYLPLIHYL